jgi:Putative transposase/Transposase zinc-binding domain
MRPAYELADVLNAHWNEVLLSAHFNTWQLRTLNALRRCRSAEMGGHIDGCDNCGYLRISYNSCRNRHCPKCQVVQREQWIIARQAELLPVSYFHVVFTLPDTLNRLCLHEPKKMYDLLFAVAWSVMQSFSQDKKHLGAQTGMIAVLHSWGQNLSLHPHLHCIVPGGGLTKQNKWKQSRSRGKFLFPLTAMSKVYRARFVAALRKHFPEEKQLLYNELFKKDWVVYAKQPFAGPQQVIEYLGRYTHKIAISNHRIQSITPQAISFTFKDYRETAKKKIMQLQPLEFIRRFALHILPKGFVRIRHYGILSSKRKANNLSLIHLQLDSVYVKPEKKDWQQVSSERLNYNPKICPCCKQQSMRTIMEFDHRGPPINWRQCLIETISGKTNVQLV